MRPVTEAVAGGCYNACPLMAAAPADHATHRLAVAALRPLGVRAARRRAASSRSEIGAA